MMNIYSKLGFAVLGALLVVQIALPGAIPGDIAGVLAPLDGEPPVSDVDNPERAPSATRHTTKGRPAVKKRAADQPFTWEVKVLNSRGDFVLSEVRAAPGRREHLQRFRVSNRGLTDLQLVINSPSCGCLGFEKDGVKIAVGDPWTLSKGTEAVLSAKFLLRPQPRSIERGFDLAESINGRVARPRRMVWRVDVHDDVTVDPPVLNCAHRAGVVAPIDLSLLITVCAAEGDSDMTPNVQMPPQSWLKLQGIAPEGGCEKIGTQLRRQHYRARFDIDDLQLREMVAAGSATEEVIARVQLPTATDRLADHEMPAVTVPVSIRDAAILDAPPLIHFGTLAVGTTSKRSILVASRDGGDFALRESTSEGTEDIAVTLPNRVARFQIVVVSISPKSAGEHAGQLTLVPADGAYRPTKVAYRAIVNDSRIGVQGVQKLEKDQP